MAILGTLSVLQEQIDDSSIYEGINFLIDTDLEEVFKRVSPGNNEVIEIDGRAIYAVFQEYDSKLPEDTKMEGHEKYIDIQFIYEGKEKINVCGLSQITEPDEYNDEKDVYFPKVESYSSLELQPGYAAVLFPSDLHAPGCCIDKPERVKKIVVKVAVE